MQQQGAFAHKRETQRAKRHVDAVRQGYDRKRKIPHARRGLPENSDEAPHSDAEGRVREQLHDGAYSRGFQDGVSAMKQDLQDHMDTYASYVPARTHARAAHGNPALGNE